MVAFNIFLLSNSRVDQLILDYGPWRIVSLGLFFFFFSNRAIPKEAHDQHMLIWRLQNPESTLCNGKTWNLKLLYLSQDFPAPHSGEIAEYPGFLPSCKAVQKCLVRNAVIYCILFC